MVVCVCVRMNGDDAGVPNLFLCVIVDMCVVGRGKQKNI